MSSFTQNLTNFVTRQVGVVREYTTPVLKESKFTEKGVMTPEEFVQAGDMLVYKCPTWEWGAGEPQLRKSYLPADKQYLVTKNIPCLDRVNSLLSQKVNEEIVDGEEGDEESGWLATHINSGEKQANADDSKKSPTADCGADSLAQETEKMSLEVQKESAREDASGDSEDLRKKSSGGDEFEDFMEDFEEDNLLVQDEENALDDEDGYIFADDMKNIQLTRRYDIFMTYDKYYQTPRVFLSGSDEHGQPMRPEQILEDIMQDYANKTVTIEAFPHLSSGIYASIHPCKHSSVMKKIVDHLNDSGRTARVDQYIFIFLKFIQSVIPTMNYDHTMAMEATT